MEARTGSRPGPSRLCGLLPEARPPAVCPRPEAITAEATSASAEPNVVARYLDLCRLYGQRLLAVERAEAAWAFSDALGDGACLEDVYVHAVRHGAARLAACAQTSLLDANAHAPPQERPLSIQQLKQFRTLEATYLESLAAVAP